jgi:hypothetical protein
VLPLGLLVGSLFLLGPVLQGMAPVFGVVAWLGALVVLTVSVREWTRSVALAALALVASVVFSAFGLFWLLFWAATHTTFG